LKPNEVCGNSVIEQAWVSLRRIAAELGCAVNTVRRHLALKTVPKYERKVKRPTKLAPYEAHLRERQTAAQPSWIPASVLHSEIVERGYAGGLSQLRTFMRSLRPTLPVEPFIRFETEMGEQLQVDWVEFPPYVRIDVASALSNRPSAFAFEVFVGGTKVLMPA
jgi:transposase